jgi:hypothetical protein
MTNGSSGSADAAEAICGVVFRKMTMMAWLTTKKNDHREYPRRA